VTWLTSGAGGAASGDVYARQSAADLVVRSRDTSPGGDDD